MKLRRKAVIFYVLGDALASAGAWALFFIYRKKFVEAEIYGYALPVELTTHFALALILIPPFWITLYAFTGTYRDIYRKSRLKEVGRAFLVTFLGTLFLFFTLLLDDAVKDYNAFRHTFTALFLFQFLSISLARVVVLSWLKHHIETGRVGFRTILVGSDEKAQKVYESIRKSPVSLGFRFIGYVSVKKNPPRLISAIPSLGKVEALPELIKKHRIEDVIIAISPTDYQHLYHVLAAVEAEKVYLHIFPGELDILLRRIPLTTIYGPPLIEIPPHVMPPMERNLKRLFDLAFSVAVLVLGFPVFLIVGLLVKISSSGPVFYHQERIGRHGRPFIIHKFRTMYVDAERDGPTLARKDDKRITPIGRFLRRTRLDELPQFYNVLKGEMSVVGPRPERPDFIKKIIEQAPEYRLILKVRPGITGLAQVKLGYTDTIEKMLERLRWDLIYIQNASFLLDLKILAFTLVVVLKRKGV